LTVWAKNPIELPTAGILVDDDGPDGSSSAPADLLLRVRQAMAALWGERAAAIETELCGLLGVRRLRDWLRRPSGYFADHLGRWSKSRRKAPLCWPLTTASGDWALWLYYPRLTDQTLYACVNEHIDPRLDEIARDLAGLRSGDPDRNAQRRADALVELERGLRDLRERLLAVAALPYQPDQNDGVLISAAPLWPLFRHRPWQRALKQCWQALEAGDYDWAHLALAIWPQRVRDTCRRDRSIAIAHGLEALYEEQAGRSGQG
jgi:hypothetical protein